MAIELSDAIQTFVERVQQLRHRGILCEEIERMLTRVRALEGGNSTLAERTALEGIGRLNDESWMAEQSRFVDPEELVQRFAKNPSGQHGQSSGMSFRSNEDHKPRKRKLTRKQIRAKNKGSKDNSSAQTPKGGKARSKGSKNKSAKTPT